MRASHRYRKEAWIVASMIATVTCSGCSLLRYLEDKGTTPVPLNDVLQSLQVDLSRTHPLVLSDLQVPLADQNGERPEVAAFRSAVANLQCYDIDPATDMPDPKLRRKNPLIPVITGPLQLTVQGQLSTQGTITVTAPPSVAGQIARQGQQQIMLPATLVPLTNLPVFYLGQQMANIQNAGLAGTLSLKVDQHLSDEESREVSEFVTRSFKTMSALTLIIRSAQDSFVSDNKYCVGRDRGKGGPVAAIALPTE